MAPNGAAFCHYLAESRLAGHNLPVVLCTRNAASAIPEPSTWAMMLAGFAGLGFLGFRRARKATLTA